MKKYYISFSAALRHYVDDWLGLVAVALFGLSFSLTVICVCGSWKVHSTEWMEFVGTLFLLTGGVWTACGVRLKSGEVADLEKTIQPAKNLKAKIEKQGASGSVVIYDQVEQEFLERSVELTQTLVHVLKVSSTFASNGAVFLIIGTAFLFVGQFNHLYEFLLHSIASKAH